MSKAQRLEPGTHEDAIAARELEIEQAKLQNADSATRFPLKIKEFRGKGLVPGFFPWNGVRVTPGEVFYAKNRDEARAFIATGLVELVIEEEADPLAP